MNPENQQTISLRDILYIYFKHQFKILFIFFGTTLIVVCLVYYFPEKYEVSAKLLVKPGRENLPASPTINYPTLSTIAEMQDSINSEVEILKSTILIEHMVDSLGVEFFEPVESDPKTFFQKVKAIMASSIGAVKEFILSIAYKLDILREITPFEETVLRIKKNLYIAMEKDSNIIYIVLKTPDPERDKKAVNRFIDLYLKNRIEIYKNTGVYDFFVEQVEKYDILLQSSEQRLILYKETNRITSLDSQREILLKQLLEERLRMEQNRAEIHEVNTNVQTLSSEIKKVQEKEILQQQEVAKKPLRSDDYRRIESVTTVTGLNQTYKKLEAELILMRARLSAIIARQSEQKSVIEKYERELESLNSYENEIKRLSRNISVIEDNYLLYKKKMEESRIQNALDQSRIVNISVASAATYLPIPLKKMNVIPRKIYFIAIAMVASLTMGVILALLLEYFDHRINDRRDVENYLNIITLGTYHQSKELSKLFE